MKSEDDKIRTESFDFLGLPLSHGPLFFERCFGILPFEPLGRGVLYDAGAKAARRDAIGFPTSVRGLSQVFKIVRSRP